MKFNITITEGLAEIKTIGKRIETKNKQLLSYLTRDARLRDPLEKEEGGSVEFIKRERQAISDLGKRMVNLRQAIQQANMVTPLGLNGTEMTVYEWLIWRREVAPLEQNRLGDIWTALTTARTNAQRIGYNVVAAAAAVQGGSNEPKEIIVNVNEKEIAQEREALEKTLGDLDGRLSLLNATTMI